MPCMVAESEAKSAVAVVSMVADVKTGDGDALTLSEFDLIQNRSKWISHLSSGCERR